MEERGSPNQLGFARLPSGATHPKVTKPAGFPRFDGYRAQHIRHCQPRGDQPTLSTNPALLTPSCLSENARVEFAQRRSIRKLDSQGRALVDVKGNPVYQTPDYLQHITWQPDAPIAIPLSPFMISSQPVSALPTTPQTTAEIPTFVATPPAGLPRPVPLRLSPLAPAAAPPVTPAADPPVTPAAAPARIEGYVLGEITLDSTILGSKARELARDLYHLLRYKNLTARPDSAPQPPRRPQPTTPFCAPTWDVLNQQEDFVKEGPQEPDDRVAFLFVATVGQPSRAQVTVFEEEAVRCGLGKYLTTGRLRLLCVENTRFGQIKLVPVRPPVTA
ncbi:hypothetical protein PAPYR_6734 [Paratrimastix pyriformis]|uniref:Uncharacterized protein n=1 Tax=Paratrimastix pyriformis TaxID=342808 RepID=A0ABQ8UEJ5_9EUKA|nr:hypothetical protein PAPYR_6734 [Paratrimastix pyriformis]